MCFESHLQIHVFVPHSSAGQMQVTEFAYLMKIFCDNSAAT